MSTPRPERPTAPIVEDHDPDDDDGLNRTEPQPTALDVLEMFVQCDEEQRELVLLAFGRLHGLPGMPLEFELAVLARADILLASPDEVTRATGAELKATFGGGK